MIKSMFKFLKRKEDPRDLLKLNQKRNQVGQKIYEAITESLWMLLFDNSMKFDIYINTETFEVTPFYVLFDKTHPSSNMQKLLRLDNTNFKHKFRFEDDVKSKSDLDQELKDDIDVFFHLLCSDIFINNKIHSKLKSIVNKNSI